MIEKYVLSVSSRRSEMPCFVSHTKHKRIRRKPGVLGNNERASEGNLEEQLQRIHHYYSVLHHWFPSPQ